MVYPARYSTQGFSLIEVMAVVAILAVCAAAVGPVYRVVQVKNDLESATVGAVSSLHRAQAAAQSGNADTNWGVKFFSTNAVVFAGSSYASRQTSYDERLDFPGSITVAGNTEVVFTKFTGLPQVVGTTTITNPSGTKSLVLNGVGTINY